LLIDLWCKATNDNLPIHEEKSRGVYVKGLLEVYVSCVSEVYEVMRRGQSARVVAYTQMNAESSRSHSIFVLTINQKNVADGSNRSGKLYLVDLAGSEKVGKTGASGQTLEEAKKINKSLTALGMVINSLTDGKSTHVPYRDSKLTRILQESLGGNSRTTLIINASPSSFNESETLSTLRFGMRAKSIKNKAKINQELSALELKALLRRVEQQSLTFKDYIELLEGEVAKWRSGTPVPPENHVSYDRYLAGELGGVPRSPVQVLPIMNEPNLSSTCTNPSPPQSSFLSKDSHARASTPALVDDEREEFLKRENELMDELSKKETDLEHQRVYTKSLSDELDLLRKREADIFEENKEISAELHHTKVQLEKQTFATTEAEIAVESLKDQCDDLKSQNRELSGRLLDAEKSMKISEEGEKERKKAEKMVHLMSQLDPALSVSEREQKLRSDLQALLGDPSGKCFTRGLATNNGDEKQDSEMEMTRKQLETMSSQFYHLSTENEILVRRKRELESMVSALEAENEALLGMY
jgi:kinesin family protein 5